MQGISTLFAIFVVAVSAHDQLTINTPANVIECQPVQFTWQGGSPPYYLSLVPGNQPMGPILKQFPAQQGTSYTWTANLAADSSFNLALRDSSGNQAFSATVTQQAGTDKTCENSAVIEDQASNDTSHGKPSDASPAALLADAPAPASSSGPSPMPAATLPPGSTLQPPTSSSLSVATVVSHSAVASASAGSHVASGAMGALSVDGRLAVAIGAAFGAALWI